MRWMITDFELRAPSLLTGGGCPVAGGRDRDWVKQ